VGILVRVVFSSVIGGVYGFLPGLWKISFLFLFPLMKNQPSKNIFIYAFSFYVVSMVPVALMSFGYTGGILFSFFMFASVVVVSTLLLTFCFSKEDNALFLCLKALAFFLVFLVSPFSSFSFSSPLWLSGLIFPGFGLLGMVLFFFLVLGFRYKPFAGAAVLSGMLLFVPTFAESPENAVAIDTSIDQQKENGPYAIYASRIKVLEESRKYNASVVYYPESHFGVWHTGFGVGDFFKDSGALIVGGLRHYVGNTDVGGVRKHQYVIADLTNNALLSTQKISPKIFNSYVAEDSEGAKENRASGIVNVLGEDVGLIICWESLNTLALVKRLIDEPRYVVLFANTYWSKYYAAGEALSYHFKAWASLFGVPSLVAMNTAPNV